MLVDLAYVIDLPPSEPIGTTEVLGVLLCYCGQIEHAHAARMQLQMRDWIDGMNEGGEIVWTIRPKGRAHIQLRGLKKELPESHARGIRSRTFRNRTFRPLWTRGNIPTIELAPQPRDPDSEASPFLSIPPRVLQQILSDHLYTESRLTMDARISGEVFYRHAGNHERTQTLMRFAAQLGLYDRQTRRITATGKDMVEDVQNSVPDEMIERWRDNARIPRIPFSPPWIRVEIAKRQKAIRTPATQSEPKLPNKHDKERKMRAESKIDQAIINLMFAQQTAGEITLNMVVVRAVLNATCQSPQDAEALRKTMTHNNLLQAYDTFGRPRYGKGNFFNFAITKTALDRVAELKLEANVTQEQIMQYLAA